MWTCVWHNSWHILNALKRTTDEQMIAFRHKSIENYTTLWQILTNIIQDMPGTQRRVSVRFGCIGLRKGLGSWCCNLADKLGVGWGSGARTEQRQKFLIPGLAKYEDLLSLAKFRTFSFHYPLSEPRVSRAKLKCRKSSRLERSLEINVCETALGSGLHTVQGTDSVWTEPGWTRHSQACHRRND